MPWSWTRRAKRCWSVFSSLPLPSLQYGRKLIFSVKSKTLTTNRLHLRRSWNINWLDNIYGLGWPKENTIIFPMKKGVRNALICHVSNILFLYLLYYINNQYWNTLIATLFCINIYINICYHYWTTMILTIHELIV